MSKGKKLLIVTSNDILVYQPTILNLYDYLSRHYDVTIISFEPEFIGKKKDFSRNVRYIKIPYLKRLLIQNFDFAVYLLVKFIKLFYSKIRFSYTYFQRVQFVYLKQALSKCSADEIIAVDMAALYACQLTYGKCEFLSLEIYDFDPYMEKMKIELINSVAIQNKMRYQFLFNGANLNTFYIPNAPVFEGEIQVAERKNLVWAGSILKRFAVFDCVDFIKKYPEYRLVLKGGAERKTLKELQNKYQDLILLGRIQIDHDYLTIQEFIKYLSEFRIGFCFYSWELIKSSINYQTAPSGKLFMYLAAGVPVIACNIPGFKFVEEFNAGILIDDYSPETILKAINKIEENYLKYQSGCFQAAKEFSFDKTVSPFINYLLQKAGK